MALRRDQTRRQRQHRPRWALPSRQDAPRRL